MTNERNRDTHSFEDRVLMLVLLGFVMLILVLTRLYYLQIFDHETYQTQSQKNRIQVQSIAPPRGLILDTNGELLADNRQILSLSLIPERIADVDAVLAQLQQLIKISPDDLKNVKERIRLGSRHAPIVLKRDLSEQEEALLAVNRHQMDGVVVTYETIRHYFDGPKFVHAIGTVRRITKEDLGDIDNVNYRATQFIGGTGVERFYERSLHGVVGSRSVEIDASGRPTDKQPIALTQPERGATLTLHIDSALQLAADEALGDRRGAVVAIDPRTGGILVMVSKPNYDPNRLLTGLKAGELDELYEHRDKPIFNRAVQGIYAPGSTFKPVVGMAALQTGVTDWDEIIQDDGNFRLPGSSQVWRSWNREGANAGGHGEVAMHRAIYRSANVYFYTMGSRLEVDVIAKLAIDRFGLGRSTVFDIAEAKVGVVPSRAWKREAHNEPWYPGDSVILGIGQGYINMTPLQLATMATVFANRGDWVQPRMLKQADRHLMEITENPEELRVVDTSMEMRSHWHRMALAMHDVVHRGFKGYDQNGTAWAYIGMDIPYTMAGKSGTAQVIAVEQGEEYEEEEVDEYERNHALFIAFAPLESPEIAVAVVVENGGGGSKFAAPVARAVIDAKLITQPVIANRD
ncbi:MAG: penicillin-binding protein 2 [Gammaproteobacteria bacterium]|nr:penicillin-binding protein 2 [Gammaproteobacteria bacterium]